VVFADGFAGAVKEPGQAPHRPSGLAIGSDGALYISDDQRGRIWRVTYRGPATVGVAAAPAPSSRPDKSAAGAAVPPEGIHPDAGSQAVALPTPPGATAEEVALGSRIYDGQVASAPCAGCHGTDGKGSPQGPDLTSGKWLWGDGSFAAIAHTITIGVPRPKEYGAPMPPKGGADLSPSQVAAVAAYVWALGHRSGR
jgi:mono/diheme cytochrome c family protein